MHVKTSTLLALGSIAALGLSPAAQAVDIVWSGGSSRDVWTVGLGDTSPTRLYASGDFHTTGLDVDDWDAVSPTAYWIQWDVLNDQTSTTDMGDLMSAPLTGSAGLVRGDLTGLAQDLKLSGNTGYWGSWSNKAVESAALDGTGSVTTEYSDTGTGNITAVARSGSDLYWLDVGNDQVWTNAGGTAQSLATSPGEGYGMGVSDGYVYWTSIDEVLRYKLDGTGSVETLYSGADTVGSAMDLEIVDDMLVWAEGRTGGEVAFVKAFKDGSGGITDIYSTTASSAGVFGFDIRPSAVPEPASLTLLGLSGLALFGRRRRRA